MAFIVPSTVADGQVLTQGKWNQDVVENSTLLYYGTRVYQSAARSTDLSIPTLPAATVFSSGLSFPATTGGVYLFTAPLQVNFNGLDGVYFDLVLTGAVTSTPVFCQVQGSGSNARVMAPGAFYWESSVTGTVGANLQVRSTGGTSTLVFSTSVSESSHRLRVTGPLLIA